MLFKGFLKISSEKYIPVRKKNTLSRSVHWKVSSNLYYGTSPPPEILSKY